MDLTTTITGLVMTALCILPFILMSRTKKRRKKQLMESLTSMAAEHNCTITHQELYDNMGIGLAEDKHAILFTKKENDEAVNEYINLETIKACRVIHSKKNIPHDDGQQSVLETLELSFSPISKSQSDISLEFYNSYKNIQLNGEMPFIERWDKLINNHLKSRITV